MRQTTLVWTSGQLDIQIGALLVSFSYLHFAGKRKHKSQKPFISTYVVVFPIIMFFMLNNRETEGNDSFTHTEIFKK